MARVATMAGAVTVAGATFLAGAISRAAGNTVAAGTVESELRWKVRTFFAPEAIVVEALKKHAERGAR